MVEYIFEQNPKLKTLQIINTPEASAMDDDGNIVKTKYDFELLDLIEVEKLSTINIPKDKVARAPRTYKKRDKNLVKGYKVHKSWDTISKSPIDLYKDQEGIYIIVDIRSKDNNSSEGRYLSPNHLHLMKSALDQEVYGFTEAKAKFLGPKWKPLRQAIREFIEEKKKSISPDEMKINCDNSFYIFDWKMESLSSLKDDLKNLSNSIIGDYIRKSEEIKEWLNNNESTIDLLNQLDDESSYNYAESAYAAKYYCGKPSDSELKTLHDKVDKTYPLLKYIFAPNSRYTSNKNKDVINYIKMVDNQNLKSIERTCDIQVSKWDNIEFQTQSFAN